MGILVILKDQNRKILRTWLNNSSKNFVITSFLSEIWIKMNCSLKWTKKFCKDMLRDKTKQTLHCGNCYT